MVFDRYVGLAWAAKGRDFSGVDCWGLLRLVYRYELGVDLPCYSDRYATDADRFAIAALVSQGRAESSWIEVAQGDEMSFDAVLMRDGRSESHIGLVTRKGRVLHVERRRSSAIEDYRGGPLKNRLVGFYRYREAC